MKGFTLLILFLLTCAPLNAQTTSSPTPNAQVDKLFAQWDKPDSPGCALGVIKEGKFVYTRGYGSANLDYNVPLSADSVFYIASTSKQFTAASILLLARQGKLALNDEVRKYIPELPQYEAPITVEHLVHHTSGLRDYLELMGLAGKNVEDNFGNEEALELITRQRSLNFKPGEKYLYSNSNYVLLAEIIRRVSGKTLRAFTEEQLFKPLGMPNTHFNDDRKVTVKNRVVSYAPGGNNEFRQFIKNINAVGDGNLLTSVADLLKWDQNFYTETVGGPGFTAQMRTRGRLNDGQEIFYGFGLGNEEYRGLQTVRHGGAFLGFRTEMLRVPAHKFTVICLCNVSTANAGKLAEQVTDIFLAEQLKPAAVATNAPAPAPVTPVTIVTLTAAELAAYTGNFYCTELDATYRIESQDGKLRFKNKNLPVWFFAPQGKDEFKVQSWTLRYTRDGRGQISGFALDGGRVKNLAFTKNQ